MKSKRILLFLDAVVNVVLGLLLVIVSRDLIDFFGIPEPSTFFYPNILGGVLFGIGIALFMEWKRGGKGAGLGLFGAVIINLCGGSVLAAWLLFGKLDIPTGGRIFLWLLVAILIVLSLLEGLSHLRDECATNN
jgi:hypothetical protein